MKVLGFFALVLFIVLALFRHRWLIFAYIASLGWIPYMAGEDIIGPVDLDDLILLSVCLLSIPKFISAGFRLGRLGKFAFIYWILSVISNTVAIFSHSMWVPFIFRQVLKDFTIMVFILILESDLREKSFAPQLGLALAIAAAGALFTTLLGYLFPGLGIARALQEWSKLASAVGGIRYGGILYETYLSGAAMAPGFAMGLAVLIFGKRMIISRTLALVAIPLIIVAVLAGQSRATYVAIVVMTLCAFMKPRRIILGVLAVIVGYYVINLSPDLSERLFGRIAVGGLAGRSELWKGYLSRAPVGVFLLGEGYAAMSFRDFAGHMSYMEILADTGVIGLILFTSLWYHVLTATRRIVSSAETMEQLAIGRAAVWVSIAFLVSSAAIGLIVNNTYRLLFMIWLAIALAPAWEVPIEYEQLQMSNYDTASSEYGFSAV